MVIFFIILGIILFLYLVASWIISKVVYKKAFYRPKNAIFYDEETKDLGPYEPFAKDFRKNMREMNQNDFLDVYINGFDQTRLHGYFLKKDSKKVLIFVHGYMGYSKGDMGAINPFVFRQNVSVLMIDLRAHGKSDGQVIGFGILDQKDLQEWIKFVNETMHHDCEIILHGVSMGGNTVLLGCNQIMENVKGIIDDCGFTRGIDEIHYLLRKMHVPAFPFLLFFNHWSKKYGKYSLRKYSTIDVVKESLYPILFIHGLKDTFVPSKMTISAYQASKEPKQILLFPDSTHALSSLMYSEEYEKGIKNFIKVCEK